jgi:fructosamine-3-kinase
MKSFNAFDLPQEALQAFTTKQHSLFLSKADLLSKDLLISQAKHDYKKAAAQIYKNLFHTQPSAISELLPSTLHAVFKVTGDSQKIVIKFNKIPTVFPAGHFIIESWIQEQFRRHNLPWYTIYDVSLERKNVNTDYIVSEYIPHKSLREIVNAHIPNKHFFTMLGKQTATIHNLAMKNFGPLSLDNVLKDSGVGIYSTWGDFIWCNLEKHVGLCKKAGVLASNYQKTILNIFKNNAQVFDHVPSRLLHGDLATHNVFIKDDNIHVFIDWEDAIAGDPIYDIAYFETGCYRHTEWFQSFEKGYLSGPVQSDYLLRKQLYYLRIAIAKAVIRINDQTFTDPRKPNPQKRILDSLLFFQTL